MIPISKPVIGKNELNAAIKVIRSGKLSQGEKTIELEEQFKKICDVKYAIATSNGTTALHTALFSSGINSGEIITTPFSFVASANSIFMAGAKPIFVDISEDDFNIDPKRIEASITKRTRGILAVDLYGQTADYDKIEKICKKYRLILIEDACQSIGAGYGTKKSGSFGSAAAFSLYATKNIMSGEGGVVTTNDPKIAEFAKKFRNHGMNKQYQYEFLGYNYRMTDIQAAIGVEQTKMMDQFTSKRIENANYYYQNLKDVEWLKLPKINKKRFHVFNQFTLRIIGKSRDYVMDKLAEKGIAARVYYPSPLYKFPQFSNFRKLLPVTEKIVSEVLSIPVHPSLTKKDLRDIVSAIKCVN